MSESDEGQKSYARTIMEYGDGYLVEWIELGLRCELSYIHASSNGDITAYLTWFKERPDGTWFELTGAGKVLLTGPTARAQSAKRMLELHGDKVVWADILEQTSVELVRSLRIGEPVQKWSSRGPRKAVQPVKFLVDTWLPEGVTTVMHSDPSKGKSAVAQGLMACVASGQPFAGEYEVRRSGPVLYLDWETDWERFERRMSMAVAGLDIDPDAPLPIHYRRMRGGLSERMGQIKRVVEQEGIVLVVADSLMWATADDPNSAEAAIKVMESARALGATVLGLAHQPKASRIPGARGAPQTILGSVFYEAAARNVWALDSSVTDNGKILRLRHTKANDTPLTLAPIGLEIEFDEESMRFRTRSISTSTKSGGLGASLLTALQRGGGFMTIEELAATTHCEPDSARKALERLVTEGQVSKRGGGRGRGNAAEYALATEPLGEQASFINAVPARVIKDEPNKELEDLGLCAVCAQANYEKFTANLMAVCEPCGGLLEAQIQAAVK